MISDPKRIEIQKQAKKILDSFAASLDSVELKKKNVKNEVGGFREESQSNLSDSDFRSRVFANAPHKDDDFIIAEKKKW